MAYRDKASGGGIDGIFALQPGHENKFYQLRWTSTTVFRPYPCPNPQGGFFPARLSTIRCEFSDFGAIAEMVAFNGQHRKLTYISEYPGMPDTGESPSKRLHRVISQLVKERKNPDWVRWIDHILGPNNVGKDAFIKRPSKHLFLQGFLKLHGNKSVEKHGIVLCIKQSGRNRFENLMSEVNPDYRHPGDASPIDLNQYFKNPDPTNLANGRYLVFEPHPASGTEQSYYDCKLGDPCPIDAATVMNNWTPWERLIRILSIEEQLELLISAFPKALIYEAFKDASEFRLPQRFIDEFMAEQAQAARLSQAKAAGVVPGASGSAVGGPALGGQGMAGAVAGQGMAGSAQPPASNYARKAAAEADEGDEPDLQTPPQNAAGGQDAVGTALPGYPSPANAALPVQPSHQTAVPTFMGAAVANAAPAMSPEAAAALANLATLKDKFGGAAPK